MNKYEPSAPPPAAPPTYSEVMGGVPPSSPLTAAEQITPGPTIITTVVPLGPRATRMICPHCHFEVETSTRSTPGLIAYISGTVIALVGCFCGCCLIPCCMENCMDKSHFCPQCQAFLGRYRR